MKVETDLLRDVVKRRQVPRFAPDSTRDDGEDWRDEALCLQVDPELFYPEDKGASVEPAKRICRACPVVSPCLEAHLTEQYGVFGNTSAKQRAQIRKNRRGAA